MHWLPLILSALVTAAVALPAISLLKRLSLVASNFRGRAIPSPLGLVIIAASAMALVIALIVQSASGKAVLGPKVAGITLLVIGVGLLGLIDDLAGDQSRGIAGHLRQLMRGRITSGVLKAVGTPLLAAVALSGWYKSPAEYLVSLALATLTTNIFNLLDLRPGRAIKSFILLGAALWAGSAKSYPLQMLGAFIAPVLVLFPLDLRERAMLGDTGSNMVGACAGLWLVLSLSLTGQVAALVIVASMTVFSEFRSLGALIERTPLLNQLDSLGRVKNA